MSPAKIGNAAAIALLSVAGAVCVLPTAYMVARVLLRPADLAAAFSDPARTIALLRNSLAVTGVALLVAMAIGVPIGFLAFRTDLPMRRGIIAGTVVAACLPLYIVAAGWMAVFGQRFWLYSPAGAGWIMGAAHAPLVLLITGVCAVTVDPVLEEQAAVDADPWTVFRRVTLPLQAWAVAAAGMVVLVFCMSLITVTDILMVRTFAEEALTQFQLSAEPWRAAAVSLPVVALVSVLIVGSVLALRRHGEGTTAGAGRRPMVFRLGRWRSACFTMVLLTAGAILLVPLAFLLYATSGLGTFVESCRTAAPELRGSLCLSMVAATVAAFLAVPLAWALNRRRRIGLLIVAGLVLMVAAPAPVAGVGIARILSRGHVLYAIYNSQAVLVFAYVVRVLPFAVVAALPAVRQVPLDLEECAALDGCNWLQKMVHVVAPVSWRGLLLAWLLGFVLSLAEIGASFIVVPPGRTTLTIRFFTLIHYGLYPDAAGICLLLLGAVILPAVLLAMLLWRMLGERFC
ncbi:MAG: hypothetical protein AB1696_19840 [Planctomycetota bacterium]